MPSDQPVPSASLEYARHRPSGESPRRLLKKVNGRGVAMVVTPPAIPREDSPLRRDATARCTATSEDEHPEWTQIDGPCRSFSRWRLAFSI